jgi:hypothetical protein
VAARDQRPRERFCVDAGRGHVRIPRVVERLEGDGQVARRGRPRFVRWSRIGDGAGSCHGRVYDRSHRRGGSGALGVAALGTGSIVVVTLIAMMFLGLLVGVGGAALWRALSPRARTVARFPLALLGLAILTFAAYLAVMVLDVGAMLRGQ